MDFGSGQGHINSEERSNSSTIARLYNAALGKKTQFDVPDSVQHHTRYTIEDHGCLRLVVGGKRARLAPGHAFDLDVKVAAADIGV